MSSHFTLVINRPAGTLFFIDHDGLSNEGPFPASDEAIKSLPLVKIEENGLECPICLEEYEVGTEAKEMACRHKFHAGCVEKWLRVNGSCPVCRFKLPEEVVDKKEKKEDESDHGREMGDHGVGMRIRFVNGEMVIDHAAS